MLNSFLFTAIDKNNNPITDRISAENIGVAKYKLEIQGFSSIQFHSSELSNDVHNIFTERQKKLSKKVKPKDLIKIYAGNTFYGIPFKLFHFFAIYSAIFITLSLVFHSTFWFYSVGVLAVLVFYLAFPPFLFHHFITAHFWANNSGVRFWGKITKTFNLINFNKIPTFEIDAKLACADAREGLFEAGLERLSKYQNHQKVSKRLYKIALVSFYNAAKNYDEVRKIREESLREGNTFPEEMIDYAIGMAIHHQRTDIARSVIDKVLDMETTAFSTIYISFCQGVIEVEDKNFPKAEFYLKEAIKSLQPYHKNSHFDGIRNLIKTFLAITLGEKGEKEKSQKLFEEAKPYLIAHKEFKLIGRCEESSA